MPQKYTKPVYKHEVHWWLFDLIILAGVFVYAFLSIAVSPIFWLFVAVLLYGSFVEPRRLGVKEFAVGSGQTELKIVLLADFHVGPYKREGWIDRVVEKANSLDPDVVIIAGDFLYGRKFGRDSDAEPILRLAGLRAKRGVFSILGNHDFQPGPERATKRLKKIGLPLLRNQSAKFEHDGKIFAVVGIDDDWYAETNFDQAMAGVNPGDIPIMVIHNPDLAPHAAAHRPKLMLSGHTHSGQIRLPLTGPILRLPHHLGRVYDRGLFWLLPDPSGVFKLNSSRDVGGQGCQIPLIISQGLGESGPRARLSCPPRIEVIRLRC